VLLTDEFPYGTGEPYVNSEMKFLIGSFEKIIIVTSTDIQIPVLYALSSSVQASIFPRVISKWQKWFSLRFLFSHLFWGELRVILQTYHQRITMRHIKGMLNWQLQASRVRKAIFKGVKEHLAKKEELLIYSYWMDGKALGAAEAAKSLQIDFVCRAHNWDVYFERQYPPYLPFRRFISNSANAIHFISEHGQKYFLNKLHESDPSKCVISRLGVYASAKNPNQLGGHFVICSCSWVEPVKRIPLIIEILSRLQGLPIHWIHFGSGKQMQEVSRLAKEKLTPMGITYDLKSETSNEEVIRFYQQNHVDLFLLTSEYEGIPVAIMEAMAAGIPVMATNAGGISEIVNEKNGKLLPVNLNVEEAAAWIRWFAGLSETERQNFRDAAYSTWKEKFNAEINYPAFVEKLLAL